MHTRTNAAEHKIDYYAWDFKLVSKSKTVSVVDELAIIAHWALQRNGLFHSHPKADAVPVSAKSTQDVYPTKDCVARLLSEKKQIACVQRGVMRCNCIDSLDRTNVAQFCVGKCALGYQLFALDIIDDTQTESASEIVNILLDMYERMGDCLALQYGGSQMHRQMKKDRGKSVTMAPVLYRQKASGGKPKEILVSLMRHIQNSFQDTGKQEAINLFLGFFIPDRSQVMDVEEEEEWNKVDVSEEEKAAARNAMGKADIWDLSSDYYLHNRMPEQAPDEVGLCHYSNDDWFLDPIAKFEATVAPHYVNSRESRMRKARRRASQAVRRQHLRESRRASDPGLSPSQDEQKEQETGQRVQQQQQSRKASEKNDSGDIPLGASTQELQTRDLYPKSVLASFDDLLQDALHRIKSIRISGIKEEKKTTFTDRIRRNWKREVVAADGTQSDLLGAAEYDRLGLAGNRNSQESRNGAYYQDPWCRDSPMQHNLAVPRVVKDQTLEQLLEAVVHLSQVFEMSSVVREDLVQPRPVVVDNYEQEGGSRKDVQSGKEGEAKAEGQDEGVHEEQKGGAAEAASQTGVQVQDDEEKAEKPTGSPRVQPRAPAVPREQEQEQEEARHVQQQRFREPPIPPNLSEETMDVYRSYLTRQYLDERDLDAGYEAARGPDAFLPPPVYVNADSEGFYKHYARINL